MSFCFPQLSFAQVLSHKTTSITPTQNSIQSTTVTNDLIQAINHNSTESGAPVIQAIGADITLNLGSNSNLYAEGPEGDDFRAVDITIEHTEASNSLGINPKTVVNSSGRVQGIRINTASDFFETVPTPVTVNVTGGKVYGKTFAIFINQLRSALNSPTNININNAEVYLTTTEAYNSTIAVYGIQVGSEFVKVNIGENGFLHSKYGNAFTTIGDANINNEGTIHGNIRIDATGQINNYGTWLVGGNNNESNDSFATEILNLGNMGLLPFNKASTVSYTGNLTNTSLLKLSNNFAGDRVTINGKLTSLIGSSIALDVNLGADNSAKDQLIVTGDTSGEGKVYINNIGGKGGQTVNGIQIITVQGFSGGVFTLGAPVQAGNYEYFLRKIDNDFYLTSSFNGNLSPNIVTIRNPNLVKAPLVLRPAVTGFTMAPAVNFETNLLMLGRANNRAKAQTIAKNNFQSVWAQTAYSSQNLQTHARSNNNPYLESTQLKSQQSIGFLQFGSEVWSQKHSNTASKQSLHLMAGIAKTNAQFSNPDRAKAGLNPNTSELDGTETNLGAEYQYNFETGMYVNSVASISQLRNSFTDVYGGTAKQNGKGFNLSLETGKPFQVANWTLEPQAQIVFQQLKFDAFQDSISNIQSHSTQNTLIRTGVKLSQKNNWLGGSEFFTLFDLLQEYQSNKGLSISYENINANLDKKPWLGFTVGSSYHTGQSQFQARLGYEKSLSGNSKNGFNVNLTFNHSF